MIITHKYKLYNSKKLKYLNNKIDIAGIIWNHCISLHKRYYKMYHKYLNSYKLKKHLTKLKKLKKHSYWRFVNSQTIQDITERIDKSYAQFFKKIKKKQKDRPPKFKKVKKYKSITFKQTGYKILENNKLQIQGRIFKYSKSREVPESIKTLSVKRTDSGFYLFISFEKDIREFDVQYNFMLGKITGIDVGLKTFITFPDGEKRESPQFFKKSLRRIRKRNRELSRKAEHSNHWKESKVRLSKAHEDIKNKRRDYFFKISDELTKEYDYIFIEDLNLRAWKKLWGRKVSDLAIGEFFRTLEYQGKKNNCIVHKIDRFFPSSKLCNQCGYVYKELSLKQRKWICPNCGILHDRDVNAAINIEREGASSLKLDNVRLSDSESNYCLSLESHML